MAFLLPFVPFIPLTIAIGGAAGLTTWAVKDSHKRSTADTNLVTIFHLQGIEDLRLKDLHRFEGLQMNVTEPGRAVFSSPALQEVEGRMHHEGLHDGLHTGNLSFVVPGLETKIQADWTTVDPSRENEAARTRFEKLADGLRESKRRAGEQADMGMVDAWLQMRRNQLAQEKVSEGAQ